MSISIPPSPLRPGVHVIVLYIRVSISVLQIRSLPSFLGFPGTSDGKKSTCNAGDMGSICGSGRSPGEENGYPLQYSCPENSMDRGAWQAIVHGAAKSWT